MALLIISFSCTVKQEITFQPDGSGSLEMNVVLMDGFYDYLKEMVQDASDFGYSGSVEVMDLDLIREQLSELPGVEVTHVESPTPKTLKINMRFQNINSILAKPGDPALKEVFKFTKTGNTKEFRFFLNESNYELITPLIPVTDNPLFDALGPNPDYPLSKEEYLDLVEFTMDEKGPQMVLDSAVITTVKVNGAIISQTGGTMSGKNVVYNLPLLKFLLLLDDISYSFKFQ